MNPRFRVAVWGSGNVGLRALAAVLDHPQMELVALRVFSPDKQGRDAGALCGRADTGILASRDPATLFAARPDAVLYLPMAADIDDLCRLLGAGIDVVTACVGFNHRDSIEADARARLEAACRAGDASLYATGSSPGWITELVPLALLNMERRLDQLIITDYADMATRNSPEMLAALGFGADPATLDPQRPIGTATSTPPTFRALAEAIGLPLDSVTCDIGHALATQDCTIAAGPIAKGTVAALRMAVRGWHRGRALLVRHSLWFVSRATDPGWEYRDSGWRVQVKGDTSLDLAIGFDVAPQDYAAYSPGLTAHPLINALPHVCRARAGILHTAELGMLVPDLRQG